MDRNPLDVRAEIKASDHKTQVRLALVEGWAELPGADVGLTVATAIGILRDDTEKAREDKFPPRYETLRSALMELSDKGDIPSAKSIGRYLNTMKDRVIGDKVLRGIDIRTGVVAWKIMPRDHGV
jgi:hypothetical protein